MPNSKESDPDSHESTAKGEYDSTPSFYSSNDTFEKYLGQTSHYVALQNNIVKVVSYVDPDRLIEMGSGMGQTAARLAAENPGIEVLGIDNREKVIELSRTHIEEHDLSNLTFETADMMEYVETATSLPELLVFLHSFHHIPDPLSQKIEFLEECYETLPDGGQLCIGETFLQSDPREEGTESEMRAQWANRGRESYASTFWSALDGLDADEIEHAQEVGNFSQEHEVEAGENVIARDNEYQVSMDWVVEQAHSIGFTVVLAEPVNSLGDGIVLLQK